MGEGNVLIFFVRLTKLATVAVLRAWVYGAIREANKAIGVNGQHDDHDAASKIARHIPHGTER